MNQANLKEGSFDPIGRRLLSNGIGGFEVVEENLAKLFEGGLLPSRPLDDSQAASAMRRNFMILFGFKGPAHTVVTACASGTDAT